MNLNEALYAYLTSDPDLFALVGTRVYPRRAPQDPTFPLIVVHRIATPRDSSNDGPDGLPMPLMQLNCVAKTTEESSKVADLVRLLLDGFQGSMGGAGGVEVNGAFVDDERDVYDDELRVFTTQLDVSVMHNE